MKKILALFVLSLASSARAQTQADMRLDRPVAIFAGVIGQKTPLTVTGFAYNFTRYVTLEATLVSGRDRDTRNTVEFIPQRGFTYDVYHYDSNVMLPTASVIIFPFHDFPFYAGVGLGAYSGRHANIVSYNPVGVYSPPLTFTAANSYLTATVDNKPAILTTASLGFRYGFANGVFLDAGFHMLGGTLHQSSNITYYTPSNGLTSDLVAFLFSDLTFKSRFTPSKTVLFQPALSLSVGFAL